MQLLKLETTAHGYVGMAHIDEGKDVVFVVHCNSYGKSSSGGKTPKLTNLWGYALKLNLTIGNMWKQIV